VVDFAFHSAVGRPAYSAAMTSIEGAMPSSLLDWVRMRVHRDEVRPVRNVYNRPSRVTLLVGAGAGRSTLLEHLAFADTYGDRVHVGQNPVAGAGTRALAERFARRDDDRAWTLALLDDCPSPSDVVALHDLVRRDRNPPLSIMVAVPGESWRGYPEGRRGVVTFERLDEPVDPRVREFMAAHVLEDSAELLYPRVDKWPPVVNSALRGLRLLYGHEVRETTAAAMRAQFMGSYTVEQVREALDLLAMRRFVSRDGDRYRLRDRLGESQARRFGRPDWGGDRRI
jgi:hypothetical protein